MNEAAPPSTIKSARSGHVSVACATPTADDATDFIERLRAGDEAAFERLVRENGGRLLAVARGILNNEDDAQEALQDAFVSAFRSIDRFEGGSLLSTWLHRITVNAALMKRRAKSRRPERSISADRDLRPPAADQTCVPANRHVAPAPRLRAPTDDTPATASSPPGGDRSAGRASAR